MAWEAGMELSAFFRKEGYNLCTIEIRPLCVFLCHFDSTGFNINTIFLKMSSGTFGPVSLITVIQMELDCFDRVV